MNPNDELHDPIATDPIDLGQEAAAEISDATTPRVKPKRQIDRKAKKNLLIIGGIFVVVVVVGFASCSSRPTAKPSNYVNDPGAAQGGVTGAEDRTAMAAAETARVKELQRATVTGIAQPVTSDNQIEVVTPPVVVAPAAPVVTSADLAHGPQPVGPQPTVVAGPPPAPAAPVGPVVDQDRLKAYQSQMAGLMSSWAPAGAAPSGDYVYHSKNQGQGQAQPVQTSATSSGSKLNDPLVAEAYKAYGAETLNTIDTDVPGVIRAKITSGPLNGALIIGTAKRLDTGVAITFNQGVLNGIPFKLNAMAIDEKTERDVVDGHYNGKYLQRFAFPIIADGVRAFTQARAQTGTQVILTNTPSVGIDGSLGNSPVGAVATPQPTVQQARDAMIASAANRSAQLLQQNDAQPQVVVDMHTTFGVYLLEPVYQSALPTVPTEATGAEATPVGRPSLAAPTFATR